MAGQLSFERFRWVSDVVKQKSLFLEVVDLLLEVDKGCVGMSEGQLGEMLGHLSV
jgi:hypothetical protein